MRERLKALLMGYGTSAERRAVALNAGALLLTAGKAESLKQGVELALRGARLGPGRCAASRRWSRSAMAEPGGMLGAIVARKRVDVAARLGGADADARRRSRPGCSLRRGAGPARRALRHGGEEGLALGRRDPAGRRSGGAGGAPMPAPPTRSAC